MGNFGSEKLMKSVVADLVDFMVERVDNPKVKNVGSLKHDIINHHKLLS